MRSHVVSVLSAVFPEGEGFLFRTVRNHRGDVIDAELRTEVPSPPPWSRI